jgi:hypothetical protein
VKTSRFLVLDEAFSLCPNIFPWSGLHREETGVGPEFSSGQIVGTLLAQGECQQAEIWSSKGLDQFVVPPTLSEWADMVLNQIDLILDDLTSFQG